MVSRCEPNNHAWTIVRILPTQHHTVACFRNRQDAEDHLRLLRRFIPGVEFEVIFVPPEEEQA
ncbi:MAG: hypothetical protein WA828_15200 [Coleofasciculaceae cyanobacterium]